jgi:peptidoglycan-N-acetylglucosamine deacetylase
MRKGQSVNLVSASLRLPWVDWLKTAAIRRYLDKRQHDGDLVFSICLPQILRHSMETLKLLSTSRQRLILSLGLICLLLRLTPSAGAGDTNRVVVLTFDDSVVSHATFVAPLLKKYGFGATFFITEGFQFVSDKEHYMTWEQIKALDSAGFEIGNHTRRHAAVPRQTPEKLDADIAYIEEQCERHGITRPISFCYPGYQTNSAALRVLEKRGYRFARAGGTRAFDPQRDHPLLLPQAFDGKPASTLAQFKIAVDSAREGNIAIMTFHGVPDIKHPWVNTDPVKFETYLKHLKAEGCRVIALRDLPQ